MTNKKRYIIFSLIAIFLLGIGLYNPKVEIDISSETINNSVDEQLPITANVPVIKLTGLIDELDIQLLGDGTALINFNAEGELENGTTFSAKGTASSKLWYKVTAVLYPFGLMLKGILFGSFLIIFVIAAIRNPQIIADLYRLS